MSATELTPSQRYAEGVARGDWQNDPAQHAALAELDRIHLGLLDSAEDGWLDRLSSFWRKPEPVKGLYFWGGVGRGKTFLVDLFYDGLPIKQKYRTHFHRFMRSVHERLREHQGQSDPLAKIAQEWRSNLRVLVLDEFFVTDIGDAMLLARLLERLFAEGVTLVTTSNTAVENLYLNGLQRESFLPAIGLLQRFCVELYAEGTEDYRMRALTRSPVYRAPLAADSDEWLATRWNELSGGQPAKPGNIEIEGRKIPVRGRGKSIAWFDFAALCEGPRGPSDYIEIAHEFNTVLLGGIPAFDRLNEDAARRFVNLIDELYDRHVNLVCTASTSPIELYTGQRLQGVRTHRLAPDRNAERRVPGYPAPGVRGLRACVAGQRPARPSWDSGSAGRWPAMIGEGCNGVSLRPLLLPGRHMQPRVAARRVIPASTGFPPAAHHLSTGLSLASFITVM